MGGEAGRGSTCFGVHTSPHLPAVWPNGPLCAAELWPTASLSKLPRTFSELLHVPKSVCAVTHSFRTPSLRHLRCCSQSVQASAWHTGDQAGDRKLPAFTVKGLGGPLCVLSRSPCLLPCPLPVS